MNRACQHCGELIIGNSYRVTSEEDGIILLNMVVCSLCSMEAKRLGLHTEKSMLETNALRLEKLPGDLPLFYGGEKTWAPYGGNQCWKQTPFGSKNSLETSPDQVKRMIKGTFEALRLQGQKWQQLLNVGNALQTVYPLYDSLGP